MGVGGRSGAAIHDEAAIGHQAARRGAGGALTIDGRPL